MEETDFSLYAHYRELPPSMGGGTPEGYSLAECEPGEPYVAILKEDAEAETLAHMLEGDWSALLDRRDADYLVGFSRLRCSRQEQGPQGIRLSARVIRKLVRRKCFFLDSVATERWRSSRHELCSFYVISFPEGPGLSLSGVASPDYIPMVYQERHVLVVGNDGSYDSLVNSLSLLARLADASPPGGLCRIDYLTTNPWIDLLLTRTMLRYLSRLKADVSFHIHQCMKMAPGDEMNNCLAYLMRHPLIRSFLGTPCR